MTPRTDPFEAECRKRDADKGHSPAGVTMTQAEWDRRYLLGLLDRERSEARALALSEVRARVEGLRFALPGHAPVADGACVHRWRNRTIHIVQRCTVVEAWLVSKRAVLDIIAELER